VEIKQYTPDPTNASKNKREVKKNQGKFIV
jgi:hypothetical protein